MLESIVLSIIARDVLVVHVSTRAFESAFNASGRVLNVFRSSLTWKMTEAVIYTQNWFTPAKFNFNGCDFDPQKN